MNSSPDLITDNSMIFGKNINILEYLVQKLEAGSKRVAIRKRALENFGTFEKFDKVKKEVTVLFGELEDDLKQAACAIKTLLVENRALNVKIVKNEEDAKGYINELLRNNNYLKEENENLKMKLNNLRSFNVKENLRMKVTSLKSFNANENESKNVNEKENEKDNEKENEKENENENENEKEKEKEKENNANYLDRKEFGHIYKQINSIIDENQQFDTIDFNNSKRDINSEMPKMRCIIKDLKNNKKKVKNAVIKYFNTSDNININERESNEITKNEIIMMIMNSPENITLLKEKIGRDFMQRLLNEENNEDYLNQIKSILDSKENDIDNDANIPKFSMKKQNLLTLQPKSTKQKSRRRSFSFSYGASRIKTVSFEESLREYPSSIRQNKKRFNNFTSPYGDYFTNPIIFMQPISSLTPYNNNNGMKNELKKKK